MQIYTDLAAARHAQPAITGLALGFFDGVHQGHQLVFSAIGQQGHPLSILTFWPHPRTVLHPEAAPKLITGKEHKLHLFAQAGARHVIVHPFDTGFARIGAEAFLRQLLDALPSLRVLACGPNFHFGHHREGNTQTLAAFARQHGLTFAAPKLTQWENLPISSSRVRSALQQGNLFAATAMLGRPYRLRGQVRSGRRLGHTLGFPTANLHTDDALLLPPGVYAGRTYLPDGSSWPSAINLGPSPTVDASGSAAVESHLIGFTGDLLGATIEIEPTHFLRPQQKFTGLDQLRDSIGRDVEQATRLIQASPGA